MSGHSRGQPHLVPQPVTGVVGGHEVVVAVRDDRADARVEGEPVAEVVGRALRRRIESFALHDVRTIDAGSGNFHEHFALARLRNGAFFGHQHVGPAGRANDDGSHGRRDCHGVVLEHDPEKWKPVFGPDHAQMQQGRPRVVQPRQVPC